MHFFFLWKEKKKVIHLQPQSSVPSNSDASLLYTKYFFALFWLFDLSDWKVHLPIRTIWASSTRRLTNYPPSFNYSQPCTIWRIYNREKEIKKNGSSKSLNVQLDYEISDSLCKPHHKGKNDIWNWFGFFSLIKWLLYYWLHEPFPI